MVLMNLNINNMSTMKYKVWAIGLGRTGTYSICEALRILGYSRIVHNPVFEQRSQIDAASDNGCTIF